MAAHKGKVSEWKVFRNYSYQLVLAHGTIKNPPSMQRMFPLPYDDDNSDDGDEWITTLYNEASKQHGWQ